MRYVPTSHVLAQAQVVFSCRTTFIYPPNQLTPSKYEVTHPYMITNLANTPLLITRSTHLFELDLEYLGIRFVLWSVLIISYQIFMFWVLKRNATHCKYKYQLTPKELAAVVATSFGVNLFLLSTINNPRLTFLQ